MDFLFVKPLLVTGPQHAMLLVNNTPDTISGKLVITMSDVGFEEFTPFEILFDCFSPGKGTPNISAGNSNEFSNLNLSDLFKKPQVPPKSFTYSIASDIASVSVVMVSNGMYQREHSDYVCGSTASIFEQPKACISIVLKSGERVMICPLPKSNRITQDEYAQALASLIRNTRGERTPNTDIPCKCCGKILSYPQNFCDLCGTPIHVVKRISALDGVERKIKISLKKGDSAEFTTDRGNKLSFNPKLADSRVLKVLSPRIALCVVTPHDARRLEISAIGDGELQLYTDKSNGTIMYVKCKGAVSVMREDAADPAFLYYGDMALKPAKPYGESDNVLLVDP